MSEGSPLVTGEVRGDTLVMKIGLSHIQDADVSYQIRDEMTALADGAQAKRVVIDFGGVLFMGSIGFLALMSLRRHLRSSRIILSGLSEKLQSMFVACKLIPSDDNPSAVFEIAPTIDDAIAMLDA